MAQKLNRNDLVAVYWLDAVENPEWQSADRAAKEPLAKCISVGWFLSQDKGAVRISATISGDGSRNVNVIPKSWVEKIIKLPSTKVKV